MTHSDRQSIPRLVDADETYLESPPPLADGIGDIYAATRAAVAQSPQLYAALDHVAALPGCPKLHVFASQYPDGVAETTLRAWASAHSLLIEDRSWTLTGHHPMRCLYVGNMALDLLSQVQTTVPL